MEGKTDHIDTGVYRRGDLKEWDLRKDAISDGIGGGRYEKGKCSDPCHCGDGASRGSAWLYAKKTGGHEEKKTSLRIGVLLYRGDDTFIGTLRNSMEQAAKEYEKETGVRVTLDVRDAKRNQLTQNSQAERMIDLGCDVLCVNMVDRSAASGVIDQAMESDIPIVFFNREPVAEDMNRWEKLYYVGADAKESAVLEGQILVDAYQKNPSTLDRNGDGVVSYVLLEGRRTTRIP